MVTDGRAEAQALAAQLRAERAAAGLTIDQLSEASGVPKQTLMRYLKGTRDIPMSTFYALAEGLGLPAETILARAEGRYRQG